MFGLASFSAFCPASFTLYCIKTSFQISTYFPQLQVGEQSSQQSGLSITRNISLSGPQGPIPPPKAHQLSSFPKKNTLSIPQAFHALQAISSRGAVSSPAKTLVARFSFLSPKYSGLVKNSKDNFIISSFGQSPKNQFPSISKQVRCQSSPTLSMSFVLIHLCTSHILFPLGCGSPKRKGTSGCMPAVVNNTVGSFSGIIEYPSIFLNPCLVKNLNHKSFKFSSVNINISNLFYFITCLNKNQLFCKALIIFYHF